MKNPIKYLVQIFFLFVLVISSCKKDYPKDIPDWLTKRIKECKKGKNCCDNYGGGLNIIEYKDSLNNYIYKFNFTQSYQLFNSDGIMICEYKTYQNSCSQSNTQGFKVSREIWSKNNCN